jgi:hypothetical protein
VPDRGYENDFPVEGAKKVVLKPALVSISRTTVPLASFYEDGPEGLQRRRWCRPALVVGRRMRGECDVQSR